MGAWYCCCLLSRSFWLYWDAMDCSPSGSYVHGISQARILEWVAIPSSRGSSWPRDQTCISCLLRWQADSLPLNHQESPVESNTEEQNLPPSNEFDMRINLGWLFIRNRRSRKCSSVSCVFLLIAWKNLDKGPVPGLELLPEISAKNRGWGGGVCREA